MKPDDPAQGRQHARVISRGNLVEPDIVRRRQLPKVRADQLVVPMLQLPGEGASCRSANSGNQNGLRAHTMSASVLSMRTGS